MPKATAEIPTRPFGRTGVRVSILGMGGWHMIVPKTDADAVRLVHAAIDSGITFMDNAWDYNDGVSEERMGKALAGRRDQVFLMTKVCTHGRDAQGRHAPARGLAAPAEDRLPRPLADPRSRLRRRAASGTSRRAAWSRRSTRRGSRARSASSASPDTRIPALHLADAVARLPVRRVPDAAQLLRRGVPQLRAARAARAEPPRASPPIGMKSLCGDGARGQGAASSRPQEALRYASACRLRRWSRESTRRKCSGRTSASRGDSSR